MAEVIARELTKVCSKCNAEKPLTDFYRSATGAQGRTARCVECRREIDRERSRQYRIEHPECVSDTGKRYRARHQEKVRARMAVLNERRRGRLKRPDYCDGCDAEVFVEAHHPNHADPLAVEWLCSGCHGDEHREAA